MERNASTSNALLLRLARILILCLIIATAAEFLLANYRHIFVYNKDAYPELDPAAHTAETPNEDGSYFLKTDGSLLYTDVPGGLYSVTFEIGYVLDTVTDTLPAPTVRVITTDPRTTWQSDGFITVATEQIRVGEGGNFARVTVYASTVRETTGNLMLSFSDLKSDVMIRSVRLNASPKWNFSAPRVFLIAFLIFLPFALSVTGLSAERYDPQSKRHRYGIRTAVLFTVLIALLFCACFLPATEAIPYPLSGAVRYYQPYVQQFDAFMKGQLHLDVPVSDEMLNLENPYDYDAREDASPMWDRAYYDGKYYSYFGVTPILLVYFPYYLLTGALPGDSFVMGFFLLISAIFIPLTVLKWVDLHEKKRIPLPLLWLAAVTAFIGSMMLLLARGVTPFYYIATMAGNAFLSLFLFLLLKAAEQNTLRDRCFFYVLAGLAYALLLHARLNIALLAAFLVVPYLVFRVLKHRREEEAATAPETVQPTKEASETECTEQAAEADAAPEEAEENTPTPTAKPAEQPLREPLAKRLRAWFAPPKEILFSLLALGIPVAVAFVAIFLLNHLRFGSILEFGTSYQLTVSDIRYNTLSPADLFPALYHYFFQPLSTSPYFPFFSLQRLSANDYGHYVYVDTGLGLGSLSLMKIFLLSPVVYAVKSRTRYEKVLLSALLLGLVTLALMNFSLGGVIFRYTADLTSLASIGAVCLTLALYGAFCGDTATAQTKKLANAAVTIFFLASTVTALLLSVSANANLTKYAAETFIAIRDFFTFR